MSIIVTSSGVSINVRVQNGNAPPMRYVLNPGHLESGSWVATDTSTQPAEVLAVTAIAWTQDAVDAYKAALLAAYVPPAPPTPDQLRILAILGNQRRQALVTAALATDDAGIINYINSNVTDLPSARTMLANLALLVLAVIRA